MPRIGLLAALATLALAAPASATPGVVTDDVASAINTELPAGHPCRAGIAVTWTPGLRIAGDAAAGAAAAGVCAIWLNPADWASYTPCDRRRLVYHEVGHIRGLDDRPGSLTIMDNYVTGREDVAVQGCPGPSLTERVTDRVLSIVPVGYEVTCARTGSLVRCRAEHGRRIRRYRARLSGTGITVRRVH